MCVCVRECVRESECVCVCVRVCILVDDSGLAVLKGDNF